MARRDRDNDPILDASDVVWWVAIGLPTLVPVIAWSAFDLPVWAAVLIALLTGAALAPLMRRYKRQSDTKRPHGQG